MNHYQHKNARHNYSGFTLIEVVLTIVVLSVGIAGILSVMIQTTTYSGDPLQRQQAINVAQSYMEEIISRPFYDPDLMPLAPPDAPCTQQESGRANFDDICDYQGLHDDNPKNINDDDILNNDGDVLPYTVDVDVVTTDLGPDLSAATPSSDQLDATNNQAMKITITVTPPDGQAVAITAYRTAHF